MIDASISSVLSAVFAYSTHQSDPDLHAIFYDLPQILGVSEDIFYGRLATHFQIPLLPIDALAADPKFQSDFDMGVAESSRIIPVFAASDHWVMAVDNPWNSVIPTFSMPIRLVMVKSGELSDFYVRKNHRTSILETIVRLGVDRNASDIHLFATPEGIQVAFRIDGDVVPIQQVSNPDDLKTLINLIKLHAHMDVAKSGVPQDGRLVVQYGDTRIHIRVASLPTYYGEDMALRILGRQSRANLDTLGFSEQARELIRSWLIHRSGLILVTGPTGSGKTTTLYALMTEILGTQRGVIVSLEDPIEATIPGVRQSQINPLAGFTFSTGLRAILRQDPDIIVVGEIRDAETAKMAFEAAYTGHLVISTLHTGNVDRTLMRLASFDVDPFLIANSLIGIVCQLLIKGQCSGCGGSGCVDCKLMGSHGRQLVSEILSVTDRDALRVDGSYRFNLDSQKWISFDEDKKLKSVVMLNHAV